LAHPSKEEEVHALQSKRKDGDHPSCRAK